VRIGQYFDAIVTGASDKGTWVRISAPTTEGKLVRGFEGVDVGDRLRVALVHTMLNGVTSILNGSHSTMESTTAPQSTLAYDDRTFLASEDARPLRILAEYLEPLQRFRREKIRDTIVFFGSARLAPDGPMQRYYHEARELARLLTCWSKGLVSHAHRYVVCSGGGGGIMEPPTEALRKPVAGALA